MNKKLLSSILCGVVILAVCVWFAADRIPLPLSETSSTQATAGTTTYYENFFLPTEPSMWFSVGEPMDWNGIFTFCVDSICVSKQLPEGCQTDEFHNLNRVPQSNKELELAPELFRFKADEHGTLISEHLYADLTVSITCTGTFPNDFFGLKNDDFATLGLGNFEIGVFDTAKNTIIWEYGLECYRALNEVGYQENGYYRLDVGESTQVRILYLIDEPWWNDNNTALLFTPMHGRYDVFDLKRLAFNLPQVLLNGQS